MRIFLSEQGFELWISNFLCKCATITPTRLRYLESLKSLFCSAGKADESGNPIKQERF